MADPCRCCGRVVMQQYIRGWSEGGMFRPRRFVTFVCGACGERDARAPVTSYKATDEYGFFFTTETEVECAHCGALNWHAQNNI